MKAYITLLMFIFVSRINRNDYIFFYIHPQSACLKQRLKIDVYYHFEFVEYIYKQSWGNSIVSEVLSVN